MLIYGTTVALSELILKRAFVATNESQNNDGLLPRGFQCNMNYWFTPFENPQRWMGQNTFPILLLNDDNMIGEH